MYGSIQPSKAALNRRGNIKFFDSIDLTSKDSKANDGSFVSNKMPAYFAVDEYIRDADLESDQDSVLNRNPKFGNLVINSNQRNARKNIKFFNSSEMNASKPSNSNKQKLPSYFEVADILHSMDTQRTTKLTC